MDNPGFHREILYFPQFHTIFPEVLKMAESVYKVIELVGSSETSWEDAVKNAVEAASKSLRDLRICEVIKLDTKIENGAIVAYRARVQLSFKYEI
jgi:flavin-binding protein dodecin